MSIPTGPASSTSGFAIRGSHCESRALRIILSQLGRDVCGYNLQLSFLLQHIVSDLNSSFRRAKFGHKIRHKNFCFIQLPHRNSQIPYVIKKTEGLVFGKVVEDFKIFGCEAAE
jgi:hypothetical protein